MENFAVLLNQNLDILKEIGSIGLGHASTSLSHMLNMKVIMTIPSVYIKTPLETHDYIKELRGEHNHGVMIRLQGDAKGAILQILSKKFAAKVINYYFQSNIESLDELDEMSLSVLQEIGNITFGAYCNSLAAMTGLFIDISTPVHCTDFDEDLGLKNKKPGQAMMIINNSFFIGDDEITSDFLFMPDEHTTMMILQKLKEFYGFSH